MTIGQNLKRLRRDKGITQGDLAELCGISDRHISKLERDDSDPTMSSIYKLMKAFNCSANELLMDAAAGNMSEVMAATLARADRLDDYDKATIIDIVDNYCIAKGMQGFFDKKKFLITKGKIDPILSKQQKDSE